MPVLWDKERGRIVSNSDDDLLRMLVHKFDAVAGKPGLYPAKRRANINALNAHVSAAVNDGVYRAGFAVTQAAYKAAAYPLFATLDELDADCSS